MPHKFAIAGHRPPKDFDELMEAYRAWKSEIDQYNSSGGGFESERGARRYRRWYGTGGGGEIILTFSHVGPSRYPGEEAFYYNPPAIVPPPTRRELEAARDRSVERWMDTWSGFPDGYPIDEALEIVATARNG